MENSGDLDQIAYDLDLHCFLKEIIIWIQQSEGSVVLVVFFY